MKQLWIVRHAKSSWDDFNLTDHDRPLNKRGIRDAPFMASKIKDQYVLPDFIVSSTAKRAYTTAKTFLKAFEMSKEQLLKEADLYHASIAACLRTIHQIDENHQVAAIFGHNPTSTYLIHELTGEGPDNLPTCGCALITSSADTWANFEDEQCKLTHLIYPKMFQIND